MEDIKRYKDLSGHLVIGEEESLAGKFVKYSDHRAVVELMQNRIDELYEKLFTGNTEKTLLKSKNDDLKEKINELEEDRLEFSKLLDSDLFNILTRGEKLVSINCVECGVNVEYDHKEACTINNTVTKASKIAKGIK